MKKIYLFILLLAPVFMRASTDSIPNSSFEVWFLSQWYEIPGSWNTNNSQILPSTVVWDSNAVSGLRSMRLTNSGSLQPHAYTGFPVTIHHTNVSLFANPLLVPGDSAFVRVYMFEQGQLVDSGSQAIYLGIVPGYTQIIVPISQTYPVADSCMIEIFGGTMQGSDILIDDISFDFNLGIENRKIELLNAYPNPCRNFINIQSPVEGLPETVQVFNSLGERIQLRQIAHKEGYGMFDTSVLPAGLWMIDLSNNKCNNMVRILKE